MKSKLRIGALAMLSSFLLLTSCEDLFEIDSNRVVYSQDHNLNSTADSVYSTIGILHNLQQIADRYVILGEVRGDLVDVNNLTKTSLRKISEFDFSGENEYLQVRDYYNVINNCNYVLAKMDTTLSRNNQRVMVDEYVAVLSIRAWTYMQLAINYGKVPYFTEPITTIAESEKDYPMMDIKQLGSVLIPQLMPYIDYKMPAWSGITVGGSSVNSKLLFFPLPMLIGDFYLWMGDYQQAFLTYMSYMMDNDDYKISFSSGNGNVIVPGFMSLGYSAITTNLKGTSISNNDWRYISSSNLELGSEILTVAPMESSSENGTVSEVASLFDSMDGSHQLIGSEYWQELSKAQVYCYATGTTIDSRNYALLYSMGDMRSKYVQFNNTYTLNDEEYTPMDKFTASSRSSYSQSGTTSKSYNSGVVFYRRALLYLRLAEAMNCMAEESQSPELSTLAFSLLKDPSTFLIKMYPDLEIYKNVLQKNVFGVHTRGCGETFLDTTVYVMKPQAIANALKKLPEEVNFADTIAYVEGKILDELALEMAFEGNRFGDLIRFAERRGPEFLAKRVASRQGENEMDQNLYNKLLNKSNWYLPLK